MSYIVNGTKENKKYMYFEKLVHLDIRKTQDAGWERYPYIFNINMLNQFIFEYDPETEKIYVNEEDMDANMKDIELALEEVKDMTEEQKEEHLQGRGKRFIQKQEYILECGSCDLIQKIKEAISKI